MLKFTYDNVEDIPEGMESAYSKTESGKYQLQEVEGMVSKAKLNEFRQSNTDLKKEVADNKAEHAKFIEDTEADRLKNDQDYDGLTKHLEGKHQTELEELIAQHKSEINPLQQQVQTLTVDSVIDSFADSNVKAGLGGGFKSVVKGKVSLLDGNPVIDGVPLVEYLEGTQKDESFEAYLLAPDMSGAGSQSSSTHTPSSTKQTLTPEEKIAKGLMGR